MITFVAAKLSVFSSLLWLLSVLAPVAVLALKILVRTALWSSPTMVHSIKIFDPFTTADQADIFQNMSFNPGW